MEEALREMLLNDNRLEDTSHAFAKPAEEVALEQADLNYWNSPITPAARTEALPAPEIPTTLDIAVAPAPLDTVEIPTHTRVDISSTDDPLLEAILELGGTIRPMEEKPKAKAGRIPLPPKIASAAPKASPQRRRKPNRLDIPDEPTLPIPATPSNAPVQLTLF